MKKFALILAAVLTMSMFTACGNKDNTKEEMITENTTIDTTDETSGNTTDETAVDITEGAAVDTTDETMVDVTEDSTEAEAATGAYTVCNTTGEPVTELYLYETGAEEKGENLAGEGLQDTEELEVTYDGTAETVLTLAFSTESGFNGVFENLYIEEVKINLLAADAMTGATPIQFVAE